MAVILTPRQPAFDLIERSRPMSPPTQPETSILKVFDEHVGQLLVLGAAGAGKTTLLLKLLASLLDRAEHRPLDAIPVFFNLSSWARKRSPLASWLAEELLEHYDIPSREAETWVRNDQILPILDGFDETDEHRGTCVEAINVFRKAHGLLHIVIASREAEYEALTPQLRLPGCVYIQRLNREQISTLVGGFDTYVRERLRTALTNKSDRGQLKIRRGQLKFPSRREAEAIQVNDDLYGERSAGKAAVAA